MRVYETKRLFIFGLMTVLTFVSGCAEQVSFQVDNPLTNSETVAVHGTLAKPEGPGPFPAMVLLQTSGGQTERHIEWANSLKDWGYVALAVDTFGSHSARSPGAWDMSNDAIGALKFLARLPYVDENRIGVMGRSLGGSVIDDYIIMGQAPDSKLRYKAAVNLYGRCDNLETARTEDKDFSKKLFPIVIITGALEDMGRRLPCEALIGKSPLIQVHILPDAYHAFDSFHGGGTRYDRGGNKMQHNPTAEATAISLIKEFLENHLRR